MATFEIYMFGEFSVRRGERAIGSLEASRAQELLCYLLLNRSRPHPRESLASLLWGDNTTAQSKKYLRQALWQLQSALGESRASDSDGLLLANPEWVRLNPQSDRWLDVAVFEEACRATNGILGPELDSRQVLILQAAVDLYTGDLLDGCYYEWCMPERERLRSKYMAALDKLVAYSEAHAQYERGLDYGERILRYDRARERTHRQLMRLLYLSGDRTAALRQYDRCATALHEEFGVRPGRRTTELHEQIRADNLPGAVPPADAPSPPLPQMLDRLRHLQSLLMDAERQIQHDIQTIELAPRL